MHAIAMLHRTLTACCLHIHAKRLTNLCATTNAAVSGFPLTLSALGRGLPGPVSMKHNIKRIDRLLGNSALHADIPLVCQALAQQSLFQAATPVRLKFLTDNAGAYRVHETHAIAKPLGIKLIHTPVCSTQSNGMAECFVNTFKRDYIRQMDCSTPAMTLAQLPDAFEHFNKVYAFGIEITSHA